MHSTPGSTSSYTGKSSTRYGCQHCLLTSYRWLTSSHYTVSQKKQDTKLLPITSPNINRFSIFFSLTDSLVNLQQIHAYMSHHPFNMLLHYLVKNECQKTGGNLKYVLWLMINHKVAQPNIYVVMGYFVTNFSVNLLVKQFFYIGKHLPKLQAKWLIVSYAPFALRVLSSKMHNSLDK